MPKIFTSNFNCSHLVTFVGIIEYILPTLSATRCNLEFFKIKYVHLKVALR